MIIKCVYKHVSGWMLKDYSNKVTGRSLLALQQPHDTRVTFSSLKWKHDHIHVIKFKLIVKLLFYLIHIHIL